MKFTFKCDNCGKMITRDMKSKGNMEKQTHHFCDKKCFSEFRRADVNKVTCDFCGKEFDETRAQRYQRTKQHFCNQACFISFKRTGAKKQIATGIMEIDNVVNKDKNVTEIHLADTFYNGTPMKRIVKINTCYLKEAKAILRNKHWEGKNKCVKLEGD